MIVTVRKLAPDGEDTVVGTIRYDGKKYRLKPDLPLLRKIVTTPVMDTVGQRVLTHKDGEQFLAALHRQWKSAYLRVSEPTDSVG